MSPNCALDPPVDTEPTLPPVATEEPPADEEVPPCPPLAEPPCPPLALDTPDVLLLAEPPVAVPPAAAPPAPPAPPLDVDVIWARAGGVAAATARATVTNHNDRFISPPLSGHFKRNSGNPSGRVPRMRCFPITAYGPPRCQHPRQELRTA